MNRALTRIRVGSSLIGMLCAVALVAGFAQAQTYPSRAIEFVAQSSAGGGTDLFSRSITDLLTKQKSFSQPLINANRVGGGGVIERNMFENRYLDGAGFGKYLLDNRLVQEEFLRAIGVVK